MGSAKARRVGVLGSKFVIEWPMNNAILQFVRDEIPGRQFNSKADPPHWTTPQTFGAVQKLHEMIEKYDFEVTIAASQKLEELAVLAEKSFAESKESEAEIEIPGFLKTLHPFQRAGVRYAIRTKRTFIADDMRLGKTLQALGAIEKEGAYPAIVVCPAIVKPNWGREIQACVPHRSFEIVRSATKPWYRGADFTIINYDIVEDFVEPLVKIGPRAIVFDESHYCKEAKSRRTKACRELATDSGAEYRFNLTGTPNPNGRPIEFVPQLGLINRLEDLGGWKFFTKRYCKATKTRFGLDLSGSSNEAELATRLRASCFIRRTKEQELNYLPKTVPVPIEIDNRDEYEKAERDLIAWIQETEGDEAAAKALRAEQLVRIEKLKQICARGKLKTAIAWIEDFVDLHGKMVVYAYHKDVQEKLALAFPNTAQVLAGDTPQEKQSEIDKFQVVDDCTTIICPLNIIGVSTSASSNGAFVEFGWNHSTQDQARDRMALIGKKDVITSWNLYGVGTIDEDILDLIEEKRVSAAGQTGSGEESILADLVSRLRRRK